MSDNEDDDDMVEVRVICVSKRTVWLLPVTAGSSGDPD